MEKLTKMVAVLNKRFGKDQYIIFVTPYLVFAIGMIVSLGWAFNLEWVTSISRDWVTMKFATSIGFVLLGGMMLAKSYHKKYFLFGFLFASIVWLLVSWAVGNPACFLPNFEAQGALYSPINDYPSLATIMLFCASAIDIVRPNRHLSYAIVALSSSALIGYLLNIEYLYYYFEGYSTAVAFHTAVPFLHVGLWGLTIKN
jgi:hypothetical protein